MKIIYEGLLCHLLQRVFLLSSHLALHINLFESGEEFIGLIVVPFFWAKVHSTCLIVTCIAAVTELGELNLDITRLCYLTKDVHTHGTILKTLTVTAHFVYRNLKLGHHALQGTCSNSILHILGVVRQTERHDGMLKRRAKCLVMRRSFGSGSSIFHNIIVGIIICLGMMAHPTRKSGLRCKRNRNHQQTYYYTRKTR